MVEDKPDQHFQEEMEAFHEDLLHGMVVAVEKLR